ncbi:hypothetical protein ScPMuIL_002753 [Solemya velum]
MYLVPSVIDVWNFHQADLMDSIKQKPLVLGGDGRCDTPGHSAKYCTYSMMYLESNKGSEDSAYPDKHDGHDSKSIRSCQHGPIDERRKWLTPGSKLHKMMKQVVESTYLLRDILKLSPCYQTYGLEVYHSVVNHFAPKSTHFFHNAMLARTYVAALHYNENSGRVQACTKTGEARWKVSWPKAKKGVEAVVKPTKVDPTFGRHYFLGNNVFIFCNKNRGNILFLPCPSIHFFPAQSVWAGISSAMWTSHGDKSW